MATHDVISFPADFEGRMRKHLGDHWENFEQAHHKTAPVSIRVNPGKQFNPTMLEQVPWSAFGKYLPERPIFTLDPLFHGGAYYVQEASSMFLEQAIRQHADLNNSLRVLDLSAAPGGKSTHLLSLLSAESLLVSNEVIRSRASVLAENIQKWGYPNCLVTNNDPKDFTQLKGYFDVIVIDAPCSGEGLFRKDPAAMREWSTEHVDLCASRQQRILQDIWPALKTNGLLIYCTCTYNESENENNLVRLQQERQVEFLEVQTEPAWNIEKVSKQDVIGYRFYPHQVRGEGFFLSVMRKREPTEISKTKIKNKLTPSAKKVSDVAQSWVKKTIPFYFYQHQDLVFMFPASLTQDLEFLLHSLRFVYGGTNIATVKHDKLIPEHALALSTHLEKSAFHQSHVSLESALQYLRKETIVLSESHRGFSLLNYEEMPIGWVNILQNRVNNMYPAEWRIRMSGK